MVCPGVVRKVGKLVPTILQALALVVCIHVVGQVVEIPLKTSLQSEILTSMGSFPNLTFQGMLARYGPAKYRFSRNYQATGLGFGSNKVSKVSFCFFCIFLQNPVLGDQVY